MARLDKEAKYRLALFDKCEKLKIKGVRKTMSNEKLEQLIKDAQDDRQYKKLKAEAESIGIYVSDDTTALQLRKMIAHAKGERVLNDLKAAESSEKEKLIAEGKKYGIKLSKRLDIPTMKLELENQKQLIKDKPKKEGYIRELNKMGIPCDYSQSITELKNMISKEKARLAEEKAKGLLDAKAKEEDITLDTSKSLVEMKAEYKDVIRTRKEEAEALENKKKMIAAARLVGTKGISMNSSVEDIKRAHDKQAVLNDQAEAKRQDKIANDRLVAAEKIKKQQNEKQEAANKEAKLRNELFESFESNYKFADKITEAAKTQDKLIAANDGLKTAKADLAECKSRIKVDKIQKVSILNVSVRVNKIVNEFLANEKKRMKSIIVPKHKLGHATTKEIKVEYKNINSNLKTLLTETTNKIKFELTSANKLLLELEAELDVVTPKVITAKNNFEKKQNKELMEKEAADRYDALLAEAEQVGYKPTRKFTEATLRRKIDEHVIETTRIEEERIAKEEAERKAEEARLEKERKAEAAKIERERIKAQRAKERKAKALALKIAKEKEAEKAKKLEAKEKAKQAKLDAKALKEQEKQEALAAKIKAHKEKLEAERSTASHVDEAQTKDSDHTLETKADKKEAARIIAEKEAADIAKADKLAADKISKEKEAARKAEIKEQARLEKEAKKIRDKELKLE
jgi:hypothetical protein